MSYDQAERDELLNRYGFQYTSKTATASAGHYLDLIKRSDHYNMIIVKATIKGWNDLAKSFVEKLPFNDWNAGLLAAVRGDNREMVEYFISKGANAFRDALALSAEKGNMELFRLFENEILNRNGQSALQTAYSVAIWHAHAKNEDEMLEYMKSKGVELNRFN